MQYTFDDIDLWIELARKYVRQTGEIPDPLLNVYDLMCSEDLRLSLYGMNQMLRYPRLRKVFMAAYPEPAEDMIPAGSLPGATAEKPIQPHGEVMFR